MTTKSCVTVSRLWSIAVTTWRWLPKRKTAAKQCSLARKHNPDIVIMDISMPDLNGIDATRQILEEVKGVKVIALSMHSDRQYVDGMLRAGVSGYLLKGLCRR